MTNDTFRRGQPLRAAGSAAPATRRAFTLIELLVVIAIIAIMAAILFPVFARARERARATACLSNEKQIGLGVAMYKQDFDGYFPFAETLLASPPINNSWYYYVGPYINNQQVVLCPDDPPKWDLGYSFNIIFGYLPGTEIAPSRAGVVYTDAACGTTTYKIYDGVNEAQVQTPASSIEVTEAPMEYSADRVGGDSEASADITLYAFFPEPTQAVMMTEYWHPGAYPTDTGLHFQGLNNIYADGHAKWLSLSTMMNPTLYCP